LRVDLAAFRADSEYQSTSRKIAPGFRVRLHRAGHPYPDFFVFGGCTDGDSGGFVLSELDRNIRTCVAEKTRKIASVRDRCQHSWLVLVDHVAYGLSDSDHEQLRHFVQLDHSWDKIILVNPLDATRSYEL
jgi:hypothetical protein